MKHRYLVISGGLMGLLAALPPLAVADDIHLYSGHNCVPVIYSAQVAPFITEGANYDNIDSHEVNCPIERDTAGSFDNGRDEIKSSSVFVKDYSPDRSLTCSLIIENFATGEIRTKSKLQPSDRPDLPPPSIQLITGAIQAKPGESFRLRCKLPPYNRGASRIVNYQLIEP